MQAILFALLAAWTSLMARPAMAQEPITAFVHVSVLQEQVLADQTVVVQGTRIVALGPADQVPAATVDGRGKFLMPGLADMHVHLAEPGRLTADRLFLYVANGVTTVREMMSGPSTSG